MDAANHQSHQFTGQDIAVPTDSPTQARPRRRYDLPPDAIDPVLRIAHRLPGPIRVPPRQILDHELVFVLAGDGELEIDHQRLQYGPHTLLVIPPFVQHTFTAKLPTGEHIALHFDLSPRVPATARQLRQRAPYDVWFPQGRRLPYLLDLARQPRLEQWADSAVKQWNKGDSISRLEAKLLVGRIVLELLRVAMAEEDGAGAVDPHNQARLQRALKLIREKLELPWTVEELAEAAGLSTAHFTRLFRRWTGHTPMDYLRQQRIERARELLGDVDLTVRQVGQRVGYDDPYHFSRVFRQVDGLSPTEYRAQVLAHRLAEGDRAGG